MTYRTALFVLSFNRTSVLQVAMASYLKVFSPTDIFIVDNGSTYEPIRLLYSEYEAIGVKVIYSSRLLGGADDLNGVAEIIEVYKSGYDYYVVSDSDVAIDIAELDILGVYQAILSKMPDVTIVGPMLTINDIPEDYPRRELCWKRHVQQFWRKYPEQIDLNGRIVHYQRALIDTTFGMVRSTTRYTRLLSGVRVYAPYEARHLDWYITPANLTDDQINYIYTSNPNISHWGGAWFSNPPEFTPLSGEERRIFIVDLHAVSEPFVREVYLPPSLSNKTQYNDISELLEGLALQLRKFACNDPGHAMSCAKQIDNMIAAGKEIVAAELLGLVAACLYPGEQRALGRLCYLESRQNCIKKDAAWYLMLGNLQEVIGKPEQALANFSEVLTEGHAGKADLHQHIDALTGLARLSLAIGEEELSKDFVDQIKALSPDHPELRYLARACGHL